MTPQQQPLPKFSLAELDGHFLKDMEDPSLNAVTRLFAGKCHQLILHLLHFRAALKMLTEARLADLRQIDENFKEFDRVLKQFISEVPPGEREDQEQPPASEPAASAEVPPPDLASPPPPPAPPAKPMPPRRPRPNGTGGAP